MKKSGLLGTLCIVSVLLALLASCAKSRLETGGGENMPNVVRKDSAMVNLNLVKRDSKSTIPADENLVRDLNIYITNERGEVVLHRYTSGTLRLTGLKVCCGESYSFYVLANAGLSKPLKEEEEIVKMKFSISSSSQLAGKSGGVLMTGKSGPMQIIGDTGVEIELIRCISKVVLKCDKSALAADVEIAIKRISLKQVPSTLLPFGKNVPGAGEVMAGESIVSSSELDRVSGEGVELYMWENMQGIVAGGASDNKSKERAMSAWSRSVSSYLELLCDYNSPRKSGEILYRFYMGETFADCNVMRNRVYTCTVRLLGEGSADENSWSVDTGNLDDLPQGPSIILFEGDSKVLYDGEVLQLNYSSISPAGAVPEVTSSDPSVVEVLEQRSDYVRIRALAAGGAKIVAVNGDAEATCNVTVENLRIEASDNLLLYKGLPKDFVYEILPESGASLGIDISSEGSFVAVKESSGLLRVTGTGVTYPSTGTLRLSVTGRHDVAATVAVAVKPTILMRSNAIKVTVNRGFEKTVESLQLETDPEYASKLLFGWSLKNGTPVSGVSAPDCTVNSSAGTLTFPNPSRSNGGFRLTASIAGGLGDSESIDVNIYEMVYVTAFSRSVNSEILEQRAKSIRVQYDLETKVRWFSNPRSILFSTREEFYRLCDYSYKGVDYSSSQADDSIYESKLYTFNDGISYMKLDGTSFVYNIRRLENYPEQYESCNLVTPKSEYMTLQGGEYIHIAPVTYNGGLADREYEWQELFNYICR